jgi:hypothetical protein
MSKQNNTTLYGQVLRRIQPKAPPLFHLAMEVEPVNYLSLYGFEQWRAMRLNCQTDVEVRLTTIGRKLGMGLTIRSRVWQKAPVALVDTLYPPVEENIVNRNELLYQAPLIDFSEILVIPQITMGKNDQSFMVMRNSGE